jgi:hypothetical protein
MRLGFLVGRYELDNKAHVLVSRKIDRCLDVFDTCCIDHVNRVASLSAIARWVLRDEASVALGPLCQDRDGVVQVKGCPARVAEEETAGVGVEVGRCAITHGRRGEWVEESASKGVVESGPFTLPWPRCVPWEGFATGTWCGRRCVYISESNCWEVANGVGC